MSISAMTMAMLLTGAGEVEAQEAKPPVIGVPMMPPQPMVVPYPVAPAPRRLPAPPQRARANLNSYFSADDYPATAHGNEEGTVGFRLTISPNGRVSGCEVTVSSGSSALDQATCRILRSRARYTPAFDVAGNPVEGTDNGRVTWRLPDDGLEEALGLPRPRVPAVPVANPLILLGPADYPNEAWRDGAAAPFVVRIVIGPSGRLVACDVARTSGSVALDAAACRLLRERARYLPARNAAGAAICAAQSFELVWPMPPARRQPPAGRRSAVAPPPLLDQLAARPGLCPGWDPYPRVAIPAPPLRPPGTPGAYPYPVITVAPPAPPPLPPPARNSPPQRARANLQNYFSPDDYPAAALRANAEGVTGIRLTVGPEGRVSDCAVTASSGSDALDQATCRILRSRARYQPARDGAGMPTSGTDIGRIRWTLPRD